MPVPQAREERDAAPAQPARSASPATAARLRLLIVRLHRQLAQAGDPRDLTFAQVSALARIEEHGPLRLGELATRERVAAPSMTRTIAPLAASGLVRREPDPQDGRSCLVTVTPAGGDFLARLRRESTETLARRICQLTPQEIDILNNAVPVLERLLNSAQANP